MLFRICEPKKYSIIEFDQNVCIEQTYLAPMVLLGLRTCSKTTSSLFDSCQALIYQTYYVVHILYFITM